METSPPRTTTQELASVLLGEDVMERIRRQRKAGLTWDAIRDDLDEKTTGRVNVTLRTLHGWTQGDR